MRYTYTGRPFLSAILMVALVFRRMFLLPSGVWVDRHVLQGGVSSSGKAVRHSIWGRLAEVPVPKKISSMDCE